MKLGVEIVARLKFKSDRVLRKKSWLTRRSRKIENVTFYKGIYIYICRFWFRFIFFIICYLLNEQFGIEIFQIHRDEEVDFSSVFIAIPVCLH